MVVQITCLIMKNIYYGTVKLYLRSVAWILYNRKHLAPVYPDDILDINPDIILNKSVNKPRVTRMVNAGVVDGNWDTIVEKIEDDTVYRSFVERFINGVEWECTPYYLYLKGNITEHGNKTDSEIKWRCRKLDALYRFVQDHGYKSQNELEYASQLLIGSWKLRLLPPELREISVNISRSGELLWNSGFHRLCIAKIQKLKSIPVRVCIRHSQWQKIRDDIAGCIRKPGEYITHPDIHNILPRPEQTV